MMSAEGAVEFRGVSLAYGEGGAAVAALDAASFSIRDGEFACLIGPSGCGKSTLLNLAAGFLKPSAGEVLISGRPVAGPGTDRGMVFQTHNLFPWQTARANVGFGPRMRGAASAEIAEIAKRNLQAVGLLDFADSYPHQLSSGMRQRVGLARAFAADPAILLMDEPFGSLDALTRLQMQELLAAIWESRRKTVLFVTHDVEEALLLADRIHVLSPRPGRVLTTIEVQLPRPRRRAQLGEPRIVAMKEDILRRLGVEAA
jgi:NitT/TauT family transport system ATP-binding protein